MTEYNYLYPEHFKNVFLESGLTMPEFLIMASVSLSGGGDMKRERLINHTQNYIRHLNIFPCGRESEYTLWKASNEELSQAIDELEFKRLIFLCKQSDIDLLYSFFSWNGIEYIANFPIHKGYYYMTYSGYAIERRLLEESCCKTIPYIPWWSYMFSLDRKHDYLLSDSQEGMKAGIEANCDEHVYGEIIPIGPWANNIWHVYFRGFVAHMRKEDNNCCTDALHPKNEDSNTPTDQN